jgi:hypothetical protein
MIEVANDQAKDGKTADSGRVKDRAGWGVP